MPDQFIETKTTGYGSRVLGSFTGIIIGCILFVASFIVLYWNEGRANLSDIAKTATEISSQSATTDATLNEKLVSTTGTITTDEIQGDNLFLKSDKFLALERKAEMYGWVEDQETKSNVNLGGSETTQTIYTYRLDWTEKPAPSNSFKNPTGHENPPKAFENYRDTAKTATIGIYNFDPAKITLPGLTTVALNEQNTTLKESAVLASKDYIFVRKSVDGTLNNPRVGDVRVSYSVLSSGFNGTVFGQLNSTRIDPFLDEDGNQVYRLFIGTKEEGIAALYTEYTLLTWFLRLVGFFMMWIGLSAMLGPISVVLDVLPIAGALSRALIGTIAFVISLILTILTILISMVLHNMIALIVTVVIIVTVAVAVILMLKNKKKAATPISTP